jgi:hypothetical protein
MDPQEHLKTYLNDHRAGASAGTDLARRIWRTHRSGEWGPQLAQVFESIRNERDLLDDVRAILGVVGGQLRRAAALVVERASRLKMGGGSDDFPIGTIAEVEVLMSGIQAKQRLWCALGVLAHSRPELVGFDFRALEEQSTEQLKVLGEIHEWAVAQSWGTPHLGDSAT